MQTRSSTYSCQTHSYTHRSPFRHTATCPAVATDTGEQWLPDSGTFFVQLPGHLAFWLFLFLMVALQATPLAPPLVPNLLTLGPQAQSLGPLFSINTLFTQALECNPQTLPNSMLAHPNARSMPPTGW